MKSNRKKILDEILSLPADDLEKLHKFVESLKDKRKTKLKFKTLSLKGKLDKSDIRSIAYE